MFFTPNRISPLLSKTRILLTQKTGVSTPVDSGFLLQISVTIPFYSSPLCTSEPTPPLPPELPPPAQFSPPGCNCRSILRLSARRIRRRRRRRSAPGSRESFLPQSSRGSGPTPYPPCRRG